MPGTHLGGSPPDLQPISANTLRFIAALACGVSLALTLRFCLGLRTGDDLAATALAGAMAACWEAAKYLFVAVGAVRIRARRPGHVAGGVALCLLSLALLIGSVAASLSYLQQHAGELRAQALTSSRTFQDLEARLRGMDADLATLRATATQDAEHGYRSRALGTLTAARQLAERRDAIAAQRNAAATGGVQFASASVLQPIASASGLDATRLQLLAHFAIALLLEAIGIASLLLLKLTVPAASQAGAALPSPASSPSIRDDSAQARPDAAAAGCAAAVQSDADAYARCRELITGGAIAPSYRAVQAAVRVGQKRARKYLVALCDQGVLAKRRGRFYRQPCN